MKKQDLFDALWKIHRELEEATNADQDEIDEIQMRRQDLEDKMTRKEEMSCACGVSYHQAPVVHIWILWESYEENITVNAWRKQDGSIYVDIAADKGIDDETIEMVRESIKKDLEQYVRKEQIAMRERIWAGDIPVVQFHGGRKMFIDTQDLEAFISDNKRTIR